MKKIYLVLLIALTACADELNLKPQQNIDEGIALNSDANVKKALLGAYDGLSGFSQTLGSNGDNWGGLALLYAELMAADGEISWVGTFNQPREIFGKKIITNNTFVRNMWSSSYYTIGVCNNVLSALDNVIEDEDRDRIRGEALFIRGAIHFEMVRFWGKPYSAGSTNSNLGVPVVLTATKSINSDSYVSRNTVEQVYQQVLTDLTTAESLVPEENGVFANKSAVAAILSRVHLQMGDFAKARDASNRVINSELYELTNTYADAFNNLENSTEDVFAIQENAQDGNNSMHVYWSIPEFGGRDGDVEVNPKHLNLYDEDDARLALFYDGNGAVRSGKWKSQFRVVPIVRLAEMYLTRAEANFRLGTSVGDAPANDINLIRARVGLDDIAAANLNLAAILLERKLELAHEGHALHDLKRLKGAADGYTFDANALVFPIPQRDRNTNTNLEQNPGY